MKFTSENFERLEKYIVTNGDNWNLNRCIEILVGEHEVRMCMNESTRTATICTIDGEGITEDKLFLANRLLEDLVSEAKAAEYTKSDEKAYDFYINEIIPETECCGIEKDKMCVQAVDWVEIKKWLVK